MDQMIAPGGRVGSAESSRVFELAAELFAVLATPMRLRVLSALCEHEKSVNELLAEIDTTQPNLSQHLAVLYRTGVVAKRKEGAQVIYRVQSEKAVALCLTPLRKLLALILTQRPPCKDRCHGSKQNCHQQRYENPR